MIELLLSALTTTEAAEALRINPQTLRRWASEGKVPYIRRGNHYFFKKTDLENFLNAASSKATSEIS